MNRIAVTGASGFIGEALVQHFVQRGFFVIAVGRRRPISSAHVFFSRELGEPLGEEVLNERPEALIHCAHYLGFDEFEINTQGTVLWAEEALRAGVKSQIFLSSITASPNSLSIYGKTKHFLETWFLERNLCVAKPGLVIGPGGLFGRLVSLLRKSKFIPLLNGGRHIIFVTGLDTLCKFVELYVLGKVEPGVYYLQSPTPLQLREALRILRSVIGTRNIFVSVPLQPVLLAMRMIEILRIPFPFSSQNLLGLKQNSQLAASSDLPRLHLQDASFRELLASNRAEGV